MNKDASACETVPDAAETRLKTTFWRGTVVTSPPVSKLVTILQSAAAALFHSALLHLLRQSDWEPTAIAMSCVFASYYAAFASPKFEIQVNSAEERWKSNGTSCRIHPFIDAILRCTVISLTYAGVTELFRTLVLK